MASGFNRTSTTSKSFELAGSGRSSQLNSIYVGFVKALDDKQRMGRLKVWVPELGGDPTDEASWFTCNYASPFAGATSVFDNTNGDRWEDTQRSYGFWFVPPDLDNEVLICFINGDPGRAIWFGCLWQQNMDHMVPGIPGNNSQPTLPVAEYNKLKTNITVNSPNRPVYGPLADQLAVQGLDKDPIRGVSDSGARRDNPINAVYGILTPGGTQFVLDDNPAQRFIRLRTRSGAQILINDTEGMIYMNSRDGKNWIEMAAGGEIDIYAMSDISIRSEGNLNLRADKDLNIEAGQNVNIKARKDDPASTTTGNVRIDGGNDFHVVASRDMWIQSGRDLTRSSGRHTYDTATGHWDHKVGDYLHIQTGSDIGIKGGGNLVGQAPRIDFNGPTPPDAVAATPALTPIDLQQKDNNVTADASFNFAVTKTIMYRMPTHEPYDYHSASAPGTNNHVEANSVPIKDVYSGEIIRNGAVVPNQTRPLDLQGTPKAGMKPGKYSGDSYDANGQPTYKYEGTSNDLKTAGGYQISDVGILFIKRWEGVRTTVYPDVVKLKTIGVGHLMKPAELAGQYTQVGGEQIPWTQALTDSQVDELLRQDLQPKEQAVRSAITVQITQTQYDMLVSLCFNIGEGAFKGSTLVKVINEGNLTEAPTQFMRWNKAGGQEVAGLTNRRRAEATNFLGSTSVPA
jgi:GH24 family phage-related lysozyme (muramidase)